MFLLVPAYPGCPGSKAVKRSLLLLLYGDPMECGFYRVQKLLEHAIKVVERTFEHRIRQKIEIDDMQFRFMKGK